MQKSGDGAVAVSSSSTGGDVDQQQPVALAVTLAADSHAPVVDTETPQLDLADWPERYSLRKSLGEGGMGEVRLYRDARIGRDVAVKYLRAEHVHGADVNARFLREARVQGQLEHPSIVPVYDMGRRPDGSVYFSMKRVQGHTLADILDGLRAGDPACVAEYSDRRLLSAFSTVCLTVQYAHSRGVLHRDLKPGNVMLGEFGEVYVLDWGLARIGTSEDPIAQTPLDLSAAAMGKTGEGALLGTPGYMSPEQIQSAGLVDARADVYALGAILFEILAREPLHTRAAIGDLLVSTLSGVDARATVRAPHRGTAPELDDLCARATAIDPNGRPASARELHACIERFLDGDRDTERRHQLAAQHAIAARELAARASESTEANRKAMAAVGRALAYDPDNSDARKTLVQLMTEPPRDLPAETRDELIAVRRNDLRIVHLWGGLAALCIWVLLPLFAWVGIRRLDLMALCLGVFSVAAVHGLRIARRPPADGKMPFATVVLGLLMAAASGLVLGSFIVVPCAVTTTAMAISLVDDARHHGRTIGIACAAFLVPLLLEWSDVLPRSYAFQGDVLAILPRMIAMGPHTGVVVIAITLVQLVAGLVLVRQFRRDLSAAQVRLHVMAWQLKQLTTSPT